MIIGGKGSEFRSWLTVDCNLFTHDTADPMIKDIYENSCNPPPELESFDAWRRDGEISMKVENILQVVIVTIISSIVLFISPIFCG